MANRSHDLGLVLGLEAEALGVPGQRTFRVHAHSRSGAARLWLEKEQLQALATAVEQLLGEISQARGRGSGESGATLPFPGTPGIEFHVGRITLGYEQDTDLVSMTVYELGDAPDEEEPRLGDPTPAGEQVQFQATREQMRAFSQKALEVCAAGRPRCPLCGTPLDGPTHFCPRSTGHAPLPRDEE
jgi:uncharacterized repeat protein (TIGR03847 family)